MCPASVNPYLTIYQNDYLAKNTHYVKSFHIPQEFNDPVAEGFKHYLELTNGSSPEPKENVVKYLDRFKKEGRHEKICQMYFEEPIKADVIEDANNRSKKTTYREDYTYNIGGYQDPFSTINVKLPDDWKLPETTYLSRYRDPRMLNEEALVKAPPIRGINNLGANEKFNKILNIQTGESEYTGIIGSLGGYIVEQHLHGKPDHG